MFARFDENPAMTLEDIKETKRTDGRTDRQRENSIPTTNKVCGGYKNIFVSPYPTMFYRFESVGRNLIFLSKNLKLDTVPIKFNCIQ